MIWLFIVLALIVAAGSALYVRRALRGADHAPDGLAKLQRLRERTAAFLLTRQPARPQPADQGEPGWVTRPDLQAAQVLDLSPVKTLVDDRSLGLAVTAAGTGAARSSSQDAYYVQRNVIALARGLNVGDSGQRAAALTLSAVMTSPLGRSPDVDEALRMGTKAANSLIRSVSRRQPRYSGMVTTLDVVFLGFEDGSPYLHFAHVGNSAMWLHRAGATAVELLTEPDSIDGGPLLRAVGRAPDLIPAIGVVPVGVGDRLFLTTASRRFAFSAKIIGATAVAHAGSPLQDCVTALADVARSAAVPEEDITIVAAEIGHFASLTAALPHGRDHHRSRWPPRPYRRVPRWYRDRGRRRRRSR